MCRWPRMGRRRLQQMNTNLSQILGIELLCAAQGVEFRRHARTSTPLAAALAPPAGLRRLEDNRYLAGDLAKAARLVRGGAIAAAAGMTGHLVLGGA